MSIVVRDVTVSMNSCLYKYLLMTLENLNTILRYF